MTGLSLAKEIMATSLVTVTPEDDVFPAIRLLLRRRITGAPVVGPSRQYLGMFSEGSFMRVLFLTARDLRPSGRAQPRARDFMTKKLLTLSPETDAIDAISMLLKHRFSGAPVVDGDQNLLGVFSEHYMMRLLINSAYEQVPSTRVDAFMNTDQGRRIDEETDILEVAQKFIDTHFRRLPVLRDGKLVGQVSRRDVLTAEHHLAGFVTGRRQNLIDHRHGRILGDVWRSDGGPPNTQISHFMDTATETIDEDVDFLSVAEIFLRTVRRRLPVLRDGKLVGQVSRRDLLVNVLDQLAAEPRHEQPGLYLSAIMDPGEKPSLG